MMNDTAIKVENLGKRYTLGSGRIKHNTLRDLLSAAALSVFQRNGRGTQRDAFWALKDAAFEIKRGENVGIIGLNGAGKSTLLKILSQITEPTEGCARICGRVGALLEVGTGFHYELTGRENVFLYGAILGMGKQEISRKYDAIIEFAGVKDFIDTPVKRYSSGMYVRLAFAVAAHLEPEILLIDEVLSVGDLPFQRKCMEFAKNLQRGNATILFVSHNMFSIKTMCRRVIYLQQGRIVFDGPTDDGIKLYEENCRLSTLSWTENQPEEWPIEITEIELMDAGGAPKKVFDYGERMRLRIGYNARQPIDNPSFVIAFIRSDGIACCNYSTEADGIELGNLNGGGVLELSTPPLSLVSELYTIHILVREKGFQKVLCAQIGTTFHVRHDLLDRHFGVFHEAGEWTRRDEEGKQNTTQLL
jgi:lipopolysaccharide transport system ATP-binding protein